MIKKFSNRKGFAKLLLIPAVLIFLAVIVLATHLPEKVGLGPPNQTPLVSGSNQGVIPNYPPTNYKNILALNWIPIDWTKTVNSNERDPETNQPYPAITDNTNLYSAQDITYCNAGNTPLKLDLYSNKPVVPGQNKPIVIYIFGGGLVDGDKKYIYADSDRVLLNLVNQGYLIASINYRLAPAFKYPAMIQDVLCSIRFLRYYAYGMGGNQNKIGLLGGSVGGQLDMLAGVTSGVEIWENSKDETIAGANLSLQDYLKIPTKPQAVVSYYGGGHLPDSLAKVFLAEYMPAPPGMQNGWMDPYPGGKFWQNKDLLDAVYHSDPTIMHEASAYYYITEGEPPFLIVQGEKDMLSTPDQAVDMYSKLKSYNNNVQLVAVKNAGHGFTPSPSDATIDPKFENIIQTTVDFFKSHLSHNAF